jgi:hypothetical protein
MIRNEFFFCLVMELSPKKKNDENFASCATRNDAVSVIFSGDTKSPNKKIYSFFKSNVLIG